MCSQVDALTARYAEGQAALAAGLSHLQVAQREASSRPEPAAALEAARADLQQQVEVVMEALKERVEQGVNQVCSCTRCLRAFHSGVLR